MTIISLEQHCKRVIGQGSGGIFDGLEKKLSQGSVKIKIVLFFSELTVLFHHQINLQIVGLNLPVAAVTIGIDGRSNHVARPVNATNWDAEHVR